MDWWNVLIFNVIPILSVMIVFCINRKFIWISPLVSTVLAFGTYMIALDIINPSEMLKFFSNNEYRGFFLLAMFFHFAIAVAVTVITCFAAYILKRKKYRD